jgi:tetratricopeptide (TPR) repeat protein
VSDAPFVTSQLSDVLRRGPRLAVREHFGIEAFGVNAFTADSGEGVINDHDERGDGQEELYLVTSGRARFTIDGQETDAPAGTLVFARPAAQRKAVADEPGTTVLAVGAPRGSAYAVPDWEATGDFWPLYQAKDYEGALDLLTRARENNRSSVTVVYNIACVESLLGRRDDALEHLAQAVEQRPSFAALARGDDDFASLRDDPRFEEIVAREEPPATTAAAPSSNGATHAVAPLSDVTSQPGAEGSTWIRVRKHFDVGAFGVNAYSAREPGGRVIEDHTETGSAAGRHQELYYVVRGRARFTVGGEELDAPEGALVFVRDPELRRGAVAAEPGTTVLAVGATPGQPYEVSPWDYMGDAHARFAENDYEGAKTILEDGLRRFPDNAAGLYNLACCESVLGDPDSAVEHLSRSVERDPRFRDLARDDDDFAAIRDEPRFAAIVSG